MADRQPDMFPIPDSQALETSFRLADLMAEEDDAKAKFDDLKDVHKDHLSALRREMKECRMELRLARQQREAISIEQARGILEQVAEQVNEGALDHEGTTVRATVSRGQR